MKTISQRQLRNDNAEILRGVESGETYTVTRLGVPVARLSPMDVAPDGLPLVHPARTHATTWSSLPRVRSSVSTAAVLDDLRGER
jgi:prevent-host-death family protein